MSTVACNGCTACCRNDLIFLKPENGDKPSDHGGNLMWATNPITGEEGLALKHKPEGGCVYVTDQGCSIHDQARLPSICREFDCRKLWQGFMTLPRPERRRIKRRLEKYDLMSDAVIRAAKARMHTLDEDER